MFSKLYKALYYQRWFRQLCMTSAWHTMRNNPLHGIKNKQHLIGYLGNVQYDRQNGNLRN